MLICLTDLEYIGLEVISLGEPWEIRAIETRYSEQDGQVVRQITITIAREVLDIGDEQQASFIGGAGQFNQSTGTVISPGPRSYNYQSEFSNSRRPIVR